MSDPPYKAGDNSGPTPDRSTGPGMPRWVKVSGLIALVVVLLFLVLLLTKGPHGPSRHFSSSGPGTSAGSDPAKPSTEAPAAFRMPAGGEG